MHGFNPETYGDSFADVYDRWYPDVSDTDGTVAKLLELAVDGIIVELGIGTGRLALPLIAAGRSVRGIDASAAMIAELTKKPNADQIDIIHGDMAAVPFGAAGEASLVFVAFNTFFNLPSAHAQASCFASAAEVLAPGGRFVVETFVAPNPSDLPRRGLSTHTVDADRVVLTATETNAQEQSIRGQHIEFTDGGVRLRPWFLRFASVTELDDMAKTAGLALEERTADWQGAAFDSGSEQHVSIYRKPLSD